MLFASKKDSDGDVADKTFYDKGILLGIDAKPRGSMDGIFTYIYHKSQPNVDKYTSPMDGMQKRGKGLQSSKKNQVKHP